MSVMTFDLDDWNMTFGPCKRSLLWLRPLRDALANRIELEAEGLFGRKEAKQLVEELVCYKYASSANSKLQQKFRDHLLESAAKQTAVLYVIVRRIARLEHEACGFFPSDLKDA